MSERIIGTDPSKADTDNDGIQDGVEIKQGTNPLDGLPVALGVIASSPSGGYAQDVDAVNNFAVTANGPAGISLFNVLSGLNPVRIQQVDTPGSAIAVAIAGSRVAVADQMAGLAIVDISTPASAAVVRQVSFGSPAIAVTALGQLGIVGTEDGRTIAVDLRTGGVLWQIESGDGAVQDLAVVGETLYIYRPGSVDAASLAQGTPEIANSVAVPGQSAAERLRLSVGKGVLYAANPDGWSVLDIMADPLLPELLTEHVTGQINFKQIVSTGTAVAVAVAGANPNGADVDVYDAGEGGEGDFLATLQTPGGAEAVSIYNGLAYVADGSRGLQVVNYRPYDNLGLPPVIDLESDVDLTGGPVDEGSPITLEAMVEDDVQVRNVEFYVNGSLAFVDGNFPFEYRLIVPGLAPGTSNLVLRARATDTGGNATWSQEFNVGVVAETVPPEVEAFFPAADSLKDSVQELSVTFSEAMNPESLSSGGIKLQTAGNDGAWGTADDGVAEGIEISFVPETKTAYLAPGVSLAKGLYRFRVETPAADVAGNIIPQAAVSAFRIYSITDTDGDGIPDDWEQALGLNPALADSDGDGTPDGAEDFDGDGLKNAAEIGMKRDPRSGDSDGNGISDGAEDADMDGLNDADEFVLGTSPDNPDSDGDGMDDASEILAGFNPVVATNVSVLPTYSPPASYLNAVMTAAPASVIQSGVVSPPVSIENQ